MAEQTTGSVSSQAPRLLAMALIRGLIDAERMRELMAQPDPLEAALVQGVLDAEDLVLLEGLVSEQQPGGGASLDAGDEQTRVPLVEDLDEGGQAAWLDGRKVREALSLPAWHHYRNLRFVAQGGMGRVFKAFDPQLRRRVALKFLVSDAPEMVQRLMLEAQLQAQVEHAGVCPVYEVGRWGGQAFIAMPFLKGQTLEVAAEGMTLSEKVQVMEQVAEAVHAAHRQGLIHRDLKPANIMVERTPRGLQPMILDFGLARGLEASGHTVAGLVLGTAHYMAPEMARGEHETVSCRTDVYSLGAILHKLFTGVTIFPGVVGVEAIRLACDAEVPSLLRHVPGLPKDLDTLVRKCLALKPEHRYGSALEVAEELRRWRSGEPIRAQPPTLHYRLEKWIRRHRLTVVVGSVTTALLLLVVALALGHQYLRMKREGYLERYRAEADQIEATLRYGYLLPQHDIQQEVTQVRNHLGFLEQRMGAAGRAERGPIHFALGRGYLALGDDEKARAHLALARDLGVNSGEVDGKLAITLGQGCERMLREADRRLDPVHARKALREAEERYRKPAMEILARLESSPGSGSAYFRAQLAYYRRDYDEALRCLQEARTTHPWIYETRLLEGQIHAAKSAQSHAALNPAWIEEVRRARSVFQEGRGLARSHPGFGIGLARLDLRLLDAEVEQGRGEFAAFPALVSRIDACLELDSHSSPLLILRAQATGLWLEWCMRQGKEPGEAVSAVEQTLGLMRDRIPGHPTILALQNSLDTRFGEYQMKRGEDPRPRFDRVVKALEAALVADPDDPEAKHLLAMVLIRRGRYLSWCGDDPVPDFLRSVQMGASLTEARPGAPRFDESAYHMSWLVHGRLDAGQNPVDDLVRGIQTARRNLADRPDSIVYYRILAILLTQQGMLLARQGLDPELPWEEAEHLLGLALQMDPNEGSSLSCRATLRIRRALHAAARGESFLAFTAGARKDAAVFLRRNPFQVELFSYLGELELGLPRPHGNPARARALAETILARYPRNPEALEILRRAR